MRILDPRPRRMAPQSGLFQASVATAGALWLTFLAILVYEPPRIEARFWRAFDIGPGLRVTPTGKTMKIKNSLKALKARHRDNRMVRRKGRIYIINKTAPRYKARQG